MPQSVDGGAHFGHQTVPLDLDGLHKDGLHVVFIASVLQWQLERLHGLEDDAHGLHRVAVDDFLEGLALVARVATLVDELHLFEDG